MRENIVVQLGEQVLEPPTHAQLAAPVHEFGYSELMFDTSVQRESWAKKLCARISSLWNRAARLRPRLKARGGSAGRHLSLRIAAGAVRPLVDHSFLPFGEPTDRDPVLRRCHG